MNDKNNYNNKLNSDHATKSAIAIVGIFIMVVIAAIGFTVLMGLWMNENDDNMTYDLKVNESVSYAYTVNNIYMFMRSEDFLIRGGHIVFKTNTVGKYAIHITTDKREHVVNAVMYQEYQSLSADKFGEIYVPNNKLLGDCVSNNNRDCSINIEVLDKVLPVMKVKVSGHGTGNITVTRLG